MFFGHEYDFQPFIEKMKNNKLTIENILEEDGIIEDLKRENSQFLNIISNEEIRKLIDYATQIPSSNNEKIGNKYQFNATEILCCDSIATKIMNEIQACDEDSENSEDEERESKVKKIKDKNEINNKNPKEIIIYVNVDYLLKVLLSPEKLKKNDSFFKILKCLFKSDPSKIIPYIYNYPKKKELDVIDLLIKYTNNPNTNIILSRLLLYGDEEDENIPKKKAEFLSRILEELKMSKEQNKYESICSIIEETLKYHFKDFSFFGNKKKKKNYFSIRNFFSEFMKEQKYIETLYEILNESKEQPKKFITIMELLIRINEFILNNMEGRCTPILEHKDPYNENDKEPEIEYLIKKSFLNLINTLEKNKFIFLDDLDDYSSKANSEFKSSYEMPQRKIGLKKLTQSEFFRTILDILVNAYAKYNIKESLTIINIIKNKNIFSKFNKLYFDFPFCNLYQSYYSQIMDIVLNQFSPQLLILAVFGDNNEKEKKNLIQMLIDNSLNNSKFSFNSNRRTFHPNFSFNVTLLKKITLSENVYLENIIKDNKNLEIFNKIIGKEANDILGQRLFCPSIGGDMHDTWISSTEDTSFGNKNFLELIEEDFDLFKLFLNGGDYEKALNDKNERIEKETIEREKKMEEKKRLFYESDLD